MGQTSLYQLPYPEPTDPADVPADLRRLADKVDTLLQPAVVSSLPASPVNGQEVYYVANASEGVVWHLRYRSTSAAAYKWEVVGGSALAVTTGTQDQTASTTFISAPNGPSLTLPLAGVYDLSLATICANSAAGPTSVYAVSLGGVDTGWPIVYAISPVAAGLVSSTAFPTRLTVAAGQVLASRIRVSGGTGTWYAKRITARPIIVG